MIPKGVLKKVDAKCRHYLWSGYHVKNRPALVSWSDVCREKRYEGLGLKQIELWNIAALGKLV